MSALDEVKGLDLAVYAAIAATPTPRLDRAMARLSDASNYSRLSIASAALISLAGGREGRRAAAAGLASVGLASAVVNGLVKPMGRRRRPDPAAHEVPSARRVPMPASRSFPSGHSAAAFAFAAGAGRNLPAVSPPLHGLAALVAYSRVHTGVHYPLDALAGSLMGVVIGQVVPYALGQRLSLLD